MTFTAEEEPPSDLFARIVAQLPAQGSGQLPKRQTPLRRRPSISPRP